MGGGPHDLLHSATSTRTSRARIGLLGGAEFPTEDATEVPVSNLRHGPKTTTSGLGALEKPSDSVDAPKEILRVVEVFKKSSELVSGPIPQDSVLSSRNGGKPVSAGDVRGLTLHKLMHLQPDKLDLSFVEKVIIPKAEIFDLCNDILPGSAAKTNIDFARLNKCSAHVVGLYGSKKVIVDVFRRLNFGSIASLLTEDASIDSGIYGFLHNQMLYVFYWHQGSRLQEASRKEVSCNFIRYFTDLCVTVYVCLDSEDLGACLTRNAESRAALRKQRTQRVQISVVKESENDILLKDRFHICPAILGSSDWVTSYSAAGQWPVRFVSGLHRCGIMTLSVVPPRHVSRSQQQEVRGKDLPELIEGWRNKYDALPLEEFVRFMQCGKLDGLENYEAMMKSFEERRAAHKEGIYQMDEQLKQEEEKVLSISSRAVGACFGITHPWEEAQMNVAAPFINASLCSDDPEAAASGAAVEVVDKASGVPPADLNTAAMELGRTWACKASDRQEDVGGTSLIFPGTEVSIVAKNGEKLLSTNFILQAASSAHQPNGPLLYKQELSAIATKHGKHVKYTMTCSAMDGECPNGPLLTSRYS